MAVDKTVIGIIAEKLQVEIEKIVPEASFLEDLGADSLDLVEMIMAMEDEFGLEISDDEKSKLLTVKDAVEFIKSGI